MLPIKHWAEEDRPREKLMSKGVAALSDAELLAILIATGNKNETAVELAKRVLALTGNNLTELGKLGIAELKALNGIGAAKAITIVAALELGRRRKQSEALERSAFRCSSDIAAYFTPMLEDLTHEEFWVLTLNAKLKLIAAHKVAQGQIEQVGIDMRILLKLCVEDLATAIVVAHNHPSGIISPSIADHEITRKIKATTDLLNIKLIDHIIIAGNKYYSFADEQQL